MTYPALYDSVLEFFDVFNFDLGFILSAGCLWTNVDFHHRLLLSTLWPLGVITLLIGTYLFAMTRITPREYSMPTRRMKNVSSEPASELPMEGSFDSVGSTRSVQSATTTTTEVTTGTVREAKRRVKSAHISAALLLTFFVYSKVSSTLFQAFACDELHGDGNYLRADYRIKCTSTKHSIFQAYSVLMMLVYPLGIPVVYGVLLYRCRPILENGPCRESMVPPTNVDQGDEEDHQLLPAQRDQKLKLLQERWWQAQQIRDLWEPYRPELWYYEVCPGIKTFDDSVDLPNGLVRVSTMSFCQIYNLIQDSSGHDEEISADASHGGERGTD